MHIVAIQVDGGNGGPVDAEIGCLVTDTELLLPQWYRSARVLTIDALYERKLVGACAAISTHVEGEVAS